jgi:hypothetical protein
MTATSFDLARHSRDLPSELLHRQAALTKFALGLLVILVPVLVALQLDPRSLDGVSVWAKPAKFLFAFAVQSLTFAWFMGYVAPEARRTRLMRRSIALLIGAYSFELAWITWQAAHGLRSHFNFDTPLYGAMYGMMGLASLGMVAPNIPLALAIWRRPAAGVTRDFAAAVVIGLLVTMLLGGGFGYYMSDQTGHAVGAAGGHFPLFGWNRLGGDLRVAHFFGIHAEQVIPTLALTLTALPANRRWAIVLTGSALYAALTIAAFVQALDGQAFPG